MRLRSFLVGVALATAGPVLACDGQEETLGSLTRCTPTACPAEETWDSLQCACVPARDAGCPLMATECPAAEQFDPLTCRCVMPATDAGISPHDATLPVCQRAPPGGPGPCATGYELDPETCECNPVADAGETCARRRPCARRRRWSAQPAIPSTGQSASASPSPTRGDHVLRLFGRASPRPRRRGASQTSDGLLVASLVSTTCVAVGVATCSETR
jgi:hypothetical protein